MASAPAAGNLVYPASPAPTDNGFAVGTVAGPTDEGTATVPVRFQVAPGPGAPVGLPLYVDVPSADFNSVAWLDVAAPTGLTVLPGAIGTIAKDGKNYCVYVLASAEVVVAVGAKNPWTGVANTSGVAQHVNLIYVQYVEVCDGVPNLEYGGLREVTLGRSSVYAGGPGITNFTLVTNGFLGYAPTS